MSKNKARKWYIKFPTDFYALGPVEFEKPVGYRKVREWARNWTKTKRLPRGFECWIAAY
jgi:hypothetical protein